MNWPQVISFLTSSDIGIQVATLNFLNNFLRAIREEVFVGTNSKATMRRQLKSMELLSWISDPPNNAHLSPEEDIAEFEHYIFESLDVIQVVQVLLIDINILISNTGQKQAEIDHNEFLKGEIVKFQVRASTYCIYI